MDKISSCVLKIELILDLEPFQLLPFKIDLALTH